MGKITEGPWPVEKYTPDSYAVYGKKWLICLIEKRGKRGCETLTNAKMIAAAPDLFSACCYTKGYLMAIHKERGIGKVPIDILDKAIKLVCSE